MTPDFVERRSIAGILVPSDELGRLTNELLKEMKRNHPVKSRLAYVDGDELVVEGYLTAPSNADVIAYCRVRCP